MGNTNYINPMSQSYIIVSFIELRQQFIDVVSKKSYGDVINNCKNAPASINFNLNDPERNLDQTDLLNIDRYNSNQPIKIVQITNDNKPGVYSLLFYCQISILKTDKYKNAKVGLDRETYDFFY